MSSDGADPGLVAVDLLYKDLMVDGQWAVRTTRGSLGGPTGLLSTSRQVLQQQVLMGPKRAEFGSGLMS